MESNSLPVAGAMAYKKPGVLLLTTYVSRGWLTANTPEQDLRHVQKLNHPTAIGRSGGIIASPSIPTSAAWTNQNLHMQCLAGGVTQIW